MTKIIQAVKLTRAAYAPYGNVIDADQSHPFRPANFGLAKRFDHLLDLRNLRPDSARLNVCVFRCSAWTEPDLEIRLLERHAYSTQAFMPMEAGRYATIVAVGDNEPNIDSLAAFVIEGAQGISYHPSIWHYPMTALGRQLDLACLVFEDGSADDCQINNLSEPVLVRL